MKNEYSTLHKWINKMFPRSNRCDLCGTTEKPTQYASIGHVYTRNRSDWLELCPPCHYTFDQRPRGDQGIIRCHRGHLYTPANTYHHPNGKRICRECKRLSACEYQRRQHEEDGTIRALSIRQPWADAILHLGKNVENRPRLTHYRGPLLIHAGVTPARGGRERLIAMGCPVPDDPPTGGIIGVVDVIDCIQNSGSPWAEPGQYHWILDDPRPLPFQPLLGRLGLFKPEVTA